MPIIIDLLAEARDAEKSRHKDPVKRAIWIASFCVSVVLIWMLKFGLDIYFSQSEFNAIEKRTGEIHAHYEAATNTLLKIAQVDQKLGALDRLTTNRFFWAPVLSALEKSTVDGIRVTRFSGAQTYTEQTPGATASGSSKTDTPGAVVEKVSLKIQAVDTSPNERASNKYKESLNNCDFFSSAFKRRDGFVLGDILRRPGTNASDPSSHFVTFVLVAHFPEARHGE